MRITEIIVTVVRESRPRSIISLLLTIIPALIAFYFLLSMSFQTTGGALLGGSYWGKEMNIPIQPLDIAMNTAFLTTIGTSVMILFIIFISIASATTARFFEPGRVEFFLSLPVSRQTILIGLFGGIMLTLALWSMYFALLLIMTFGLLAGFWPLSVFGYVAIFIIQIAPIVVAILIGAIVKPEKPTIAFAFVLIAGMFMSSALASDVGNVIRSSSFPSMFKTLSGLELLIALLFPHNVRLAQFGMTFFDSPSLLNIYGFILLVASHIFYCGALLLSGLFLFKRKDY